MRASPCTPPTGEHGSRGDFSTALLLLWPGLLLAADPYSSSNFRTGAVTLRAMLSLDFVLLRPAGFSVAESVT